MRTKNVFQRTQWPVGHGGFHTGKLSKNGEISFRYFYDCGTKSGKKSDTASLIDNVLTSQEFDIGIVSHFDIDHYSQLANAKVRTLFIPYMTRTDQLHQVICASDGTASNINEKAQIYDILIKLRSQNTEIYMISGEIRNDQDSSRIVIIGNITPTSTPSDCSYKVISHSIIIAPDQKEDILFKFYNHGDHTQSSYLFDYLESNINNFLDSNNTPYGSAQDFLEDIEQNGSVPVARNAKALQAAYKALFPSGKGVSQITPSNLSSLAAMSYISDERHVWQHESKNGGDRHRSSGWMLTGDLELKDQTWMPFHNHYMAELEFCGIFNLPHHASSIALQNQAMHFLSREMKFLANVQSDDDKHPSKFLLNRMRDFELQEPHEVNELFESAYTTTAIFR